VPQVITLLQEGKIKEAGRILFENNPLSAVCAAICPHERNCAGHCVLGIKSEPVNFFKIEKYISELFLDCYVPENITKNSYSVAVIGAGPAGIVMSIILSLRGFSVTLIETRDQIGGVLRFGIPDFRLNKSLLDRYAEILRKLDVKFKPNTFVGSNITIHDMFLDGYDAVCIAVGTSRPNRFGLLGETLGNVHYATDFLKSPGAYDLGRRVAVVGAGNVALDAARVAIRAGADEAVIINNRRECDMTGNKKEIEMAVADGVRFIHLKQSVRLFNDGVMLADVLATEAEDGTVHYEDDFAHTEKLSADTVIIAIGQGPQAAVLADTRNIKRSERGLFESDEFGRTEQPGVYVAGDIVTGPRTVAEAVAFTKSVAKDIEEYCASKGKASGN
jgi:glutamate synthase (NADPH/NADH) small chain